MSGLLSRIFGANDPAVSYDDSKALARDADSTVRRKLAGRGDVRPEVLYYLAGDELPEVRRESAANETTPRHADPTTRTGNNATIPTPADRRLTPQAG